MTLGIRSKLFAVSLGLILVCFASADLYLTRRLDSQLTTRIGDDLEVRLALVERAVSSARFDPTDRLAWDSLADDLGARAHGRVSIIAASGELLGDSEVSIDALATTESHADRPEVREAMSAGHGASARASHTVGKRMVYIATPLTGPTRGVVRLALPLTDVDSAIAELHRVIFVATFLALGVAVLMTSLSAHYLSRVVRALTSAARRMASGELDVRARVEGGDELAELGASLDQLAGGFATAMRELRDERDVLGHILDDMQEGVLLLDSQRRIARVNTALRAMLLLGSDAVGRPLLDVVRNAELRELVDKAGQRWTERDSGDVMPAQGEIELAGLKPRQLLVRAAPLRGEEGALLAVFVDVTDMRRLERMRRDFVANVSHELRTPVTAIRTAGETLHDLDAMDQEHAARFVDIIHRNAERLQGLIEDLLDLSRIESKEFRVQKEPVDLGQLVTHCLTLFRDRAEQRFVALSAEVASGSVALADHRALEQVLSNLVDNAVKYSPGATVRVLVEADGDRQLWLAVSDTGPGIASKHLSRIFERFYRVDPGRSRELGGTGLGLSIVKHLVEAMGGKVEVASTVGEGTRFLVRLPRNVTDSVTALSQGPVTS